jgi:small ligand-binding sensory domain FIST
MSQWWKAAQAKGQHWGLAVKAALAALDPLPAGGNLGFLYVTEGFAEDLSSIVTFLLETTRIGDWLGAVGHGVFGPDGEVRDGRALVLMVGRVEAGAAKVFDGFDDPVAFRARHGAWLDRQRAVTGVVHGDPGSPTIAAAVAGLAETGRAFVVGGLTVPSPGRVRVARRVTAASLSGVLLGDGIPVAIGLSQGCTPIGRVHRVTQAVDNVVMRLDGQLALDALKDASGEIIAHDLQRAAGYIHVARPVEGGDDYVVRSLLAVDPERGWLAVGESLATGDRLMFVRRDANAAQKDMPRMLANLARRLDGRPVKGGLFFSCVGRGAQMFGRPNREVELIHQALGDFPLVGFAAAGEICRGRLYAFTGVLTVLL